MTVHWLLLALYVLGSVVWSTCALAYVTRAPWWRSWIGRSLVGSWTAFAAVLTLAVVFRIVPLPHLVAVVLAVAVLSAVDLAGLVQLVTVLHLQRRDRRPIDR